LMCENIKGMQHLGYDRYLGSLVEAVT
jgi:hypothetical protein